MRTGTKILGAILLIGVLVTANKAIATEATTQNDEVLLKQIALIDKATVFEINEYARREALATQFQIPDFLITELRDQHKSWGEVTLSLAMAQDYATTSRDYLTIDEALMTVEALRDREMSWGNLADRLSIRLDPVIDSVKEAELSIKTADNEVFKKFDQKFTRPSKVE